MKVKNKGVTGSKRFLRMPEIPDVKQDVFTHSSSGIFAATRI
jgi:hypothetical protein